MPYTKHMGRVIHYAGSTVSGGKWASKARRSPRTGSRRRAGFVATLNLDKWTSTDINSPTDSASTRRLRGAPPQAPSTACRPYRPRCSPRHQSFGARHRLSSREQICFHTCCSSSDTVVRMSAPGLWHHPTQGKTNVVVKTPATTHARRYGPRGKAETVPTHSIDCIQDD